MQKILVMTILTALVLLNGQALTAASNRQVPQTSVEITTCPPEQEAADTNRHHPSHQLRCEYGLPNPMIGYESLSAMVKVLGFAPLTLDRQEYTNTNKIIISGVTSHLVYRDTSIKSENQVIVRSALKNQAHMLNISGYFYDNWKKQRFSHTSVNLVEATPMNHAASWYNDRYTFSVSARDLDREEFKMLVRQLVIKTETSYKD